MRLNGITRKFCQEERNPDTERRKVCGALLLDCEHEDHEHELGCQEYLNEQALSDGCAAAEHGVDSHGAWVHRRHEAGGCDASNELSGITRRLRIVDIPPQSQSASVTYASLEPDEFDKKGRGEG
jgi:hypothetical protein